MRQVMVVTDLTRMRGDRVCVGGYLEDGTAIRPVCGRTGPTETWLCPTQTERVVPFSVVELDVGSQPAWIVPPHTEDRLVPSVGHRVVRVLPESHHLYWLERSMWPSTRAVFGAEVHSPPDQKWGRFVKLGEGERSLGTIKARNILSVEYGTRRNTNSWEYRLNFVDETEEEFEFAVVDLAFRRKLDELRDNDVSAQRAAAKLLQSLRQQTVYLRIGLARGWDRHPDRCYLQITGVYGFPR